MSAPTLALISLALITIAWCVARWIARAIAVSVDIAESLEELATGGERVAGGRAAKATRRITRTQDHGIALHDFGAPTP